MGPIPGNIIGIGVTDIARCRWRGIRQRFAIRRPVGEVPCCRPEDPRMASAVMPKRVDDRPMRSRMRRGRPATSGCSRPCEGLVRGKHERCCTERRDKRPIYSIRHGGHQFVGCWAPLLGRLGWAFGGHKRIINYWLRFKINGGGPSSRLAAEMTKDFSGHMISSRWIWLCGAALADDAIRRLRLASRSRIALCSIRATATGDLPDGSHFWFPSRWRMTSWKKIRRPSGQIWCDRGCLSP
jgi:hypothetical protein